MKILIPIMLLVTLVNFNAPTNQHWTEVVKPEDHELIDTFKNVVTTAFKPNFGEVHTCPKRIRHYWKYTGDSIVYITRFLTTDPQFIVHSNGKIVYPDSLNYFDVGFPWHNRLGPAHRKVGFRINNTEDYWFTFNFNLVEDTCSAN